MCHKAVLQNGALCTIYKKILFKTDRYKLIKSINFSAFDFNCTSTAKVWNMNQNGNGEINGLFERFNTQINKSIVEAASKESERNVDISHENRERLWKYADGIKCK